MNVVFYIHRSVSSKEDEGVEASIKNQDEPHPVGLPSARRKSTLKLITEGEGEHNVKLQGDMAEEPRERSSRKERWQSTKRSPEKRKSGMQAAMEKFRKSSDEMLRKSQLQIKHLKESSFKAGRRQQPIQQLGTLHENQEGSSSRPRGLTYPTVKENDLKKPKVRKSSMGNTGVRFQDELEDTPENSVFEQESEQRDPGNEERFGKNGNAMIDSNQNSERN